MESGVLGWFKVHLDHEDSFPEVAARGGRDALLHVLGKPGFAPLLLVDLLQHSCIATVGHILAGIKELRS